MEVGGFDEKFLFAGGEDTDLCLRLKKKAFSSIKFKML